MSKSPPEKIIGPLNVVYLPKGTNELNQQQNGKKSSGTNSKKPRLESLEEEVMDGEENCDDVLFKKGKGAKRVHSASDDEDCRKKRERKDDWKLEDLDVSEKNSGELI